MPQTKKTDINSNLPFIVNVESATKRVEEELARERQFCDMILHVIDKIEKEGEEELGHEEFMSEATLWDMKGYLKGHINVSGMSERSPIHVLEVVNGKITNMFHDFNIYDIGQLAACTKVETDCIAAQAQLKSILSSDIQLAVEDAKCVVKILRSVTKGHKEDKKDKKDAKLKGSWSSLTQVTNLLQIKSPSKKIAGMVEQLSPKHLRSSFVDVFVGQSPREEEDINSFYNM